MQDAMLCRTCRFTTERLLVKEWHSLSPADWAEQELAQVVESLLTPAVTRSLPPSWQGSYTRERAKEWVRERDEEGTTLLVVERSTREPVGLIILSETAGVGSKGMEVRLGYLLAPSSWGKGFATELVAGLVAWARSCSAIDSLAGGVGRDNPASRRVLERSGFEPMASAGDEEFFRLSLSR